MPKVEKPIQFHTPEADAVLSALEIFPPDNPWNLLVENWPVHPDSKKIVASIGADKPLRCNEDMGFVIVPPDQKKVEVKLGEYAGESDPGPYPVPENMTVEGWPGRGKGDAESLAQALDRPKEYDADRHGIVVDPVNKKIYEFFFFGRRDGVWHAAQASVFDLGSNKLRTEGWTSADAAGLPIFPAIVRHDELKRGRVEHAMRFTVRRSRKAFVAPATHYASRLTDPSLPRMGERFRLRKEFDTSKFSPHVRAVLEGLKRHGMMVADNGIEWAISVAPDPRIDPMHEELRKVKGSDFEVVIAPAK
jgi:hypothetical protein